MITKLPRISKNKLLFFAVLLAVLFSITGVNAASLHAITSSSRGVTEIYDLPTATISGDTSICSGGIATLKVVLTGIPDWSYTWSDGTNTGTVSGVTSSPSYFNVSPTANKSYTIISVTDGSGFSNTGSGSAKVLTGPVTIAPDITSCPGSFIDIPVKVTSFFDVGAISLTLVYDKNVISYDSYADAYGLIDYVYANETGVNGIVKISGISLTGENLEDYDVLITLKFNYTEGYTDLTWDDSDDTWCEFAAGDPDFEPYCDNPTITYYIDGSVSETSLAADFIADNLFPPKFTTVQLTDQSTGGATGWEWSFDRPTVGYDGGTDSHSQNPRVHFTDGGLYTVTLTVTKPNCTDTETKTGYIRAGIHGLWIGSSSTEWNTSSNWDDGLTPYNSSDVLITTSTSPTWWPKYTGNLVAGDDPGAHCKSITFEGSGYLLTVKGTLTTLSNLPGSTIHAVSGSGSIIFEIP